MGDTTIAAADHISFSVAKGELCVVVGPSGAGKTTLLNMLGGMDNCDEGEIYLDGAEISSIARALAKNPKLVLCDEPTGALDYNTGKTILKLLQDTCRSTGKTIIIITHNSALCKMADRVLHVKNGIVVKTEVNPSPTPVEEIEW